MKKTKQAHKTKDELIQGLKSNKEFVKKMKFTREVFYPALCAATTSIDDAVVLLSGFNTAIMQEFLGFMKETKMDGLKLEDKLDVNNKKNKEMKDLLAIFSEMSVFEAKDYIEGMRSEIQLFTQDELKERPLLDLKVKWIDQL